ncbi:MAG: AAA family ATPase [Patescibacteria group bacterium]|nr:AAA family ATPase [Patescibacteria group bacterium]
MYLEKIEIFGFKSFGQRVKLKFTKGIACLIGPNGVGKSNFVEAIRWALGEQSLKTIRSRKSEDIIFSGRQKRLNFAEVFLYLKNENSHLQSSFQELVVGRKIFRNGENEYFINGEKVRLQDIIFTVSKANFGLKSYSVIGQGMVDSILYSSPLERREFFAEATGIKKYQLKRKEAVIKLKKSQENLRQALVALKEVEPRMHFLTRQIRKLAKRQKIEKDLFEQQRKYYGSKKFRLEKEEAELKKEVVKKKEEVNKKLQELKAFQEKINFFSSDQSSLKFNQLQKEYQASLEKRKKIMETISVLKTEMIFKSSKNETLEAQRKLKEIELTLEDILIEQENLMTRLGQIKKIEEIKEIQQNFLKIIEKTKLLLNILQEKKCSPSPQLKIVEEDLKFLEEKIKKLEIDLAQILKEEEDKRKEVIRQQKEIQRIQDSFTQLNLSLKEKEIELAKLETKKEDLKEEIKRDCFDQQILTVLENKLLSPAEEEEAFLKIKKLKHQLEMIEAIDPNIAQEYEECLQRYNFLSSQINDLNKAINSLEKIKKTLDGKIKQEFLSNFNKINHEFEKYFKILFKGGLAKLVLREKGKKENEPLNKDQNNLAIQESQEEFLSEKDEEEKEDWFIEIFARPPGKKIKTLETLSGGERALTSLALIFAILKIKNPPFVVLDEVDAALDEINSLRFAEIIKNLAKKIQFIIITHNNTIMEIADFVYGLTMKADNITHLVSLKLEKV